MANNSDNVDIPRVRNFFLQLQDSICQAIADEDQEATFSTEEYTTAHKTLSKPRVMEAGPVIEKAAVNFTHAIGTNLPKAATTRNPDMAGKGFEALSISLIVHPRNPYVPTVHMNLRMFVVALESGYSWHFGGGFDMTPYYGFESDAKNFHRQAYNACKEYGADVYPRLKKWCDQYFYLPHRNESRGIGGLFFDDWNQDGFNQSFALVRSIGNHILPAWLPILQRRKDTPYTQQQREFQLYRRGRYAEFNLAIDRGTKYGLQSGRRIESVLASLPPAVIWKYNWQPRLGSAEEKLYTDFLPPRDWLEDEP